jgi:hypothetical protein
LIANRIIYYNATLLSQLLAHQERRGEAQGAALAQASQFLTKNARSEIF